MEIPRVLPDTACCYSYSSCRGGGTLIFQGFLQITHAGVHCCVQAQAPVQGITEPHTGVPTNSWSLTSTEPSALEKHSVLFPFLLSFHLNGISNLPLFPITPPSPQALTLGTCSAAYFVLHPHRAHFPPPPPPFSGASAAQTLPV